MTVTPVTSPDRLHSRLTRYASQFGDLLDVFGCYCATDKRIDCNGVILSAACNTGGKGSNQDASVFWLPHPKPPTRLRWAAGIADGVSSSVYSALGSRLACNAAITHLDLAYRDTTATVSPVSFCSKVFLREGEQIAQAAEEYRPPGFTKSTWRRVLRDGRFAQTTLIAAWEDDIGLHIEGIGDGGFTLSFEPDSASISFLPTSDKPVQCLGPYSPFTAPDYRLDIPTWNSLQMFTDGVTPVAIKRGRAIEQHLDCHAAKPGANPALATINAMMQHDAELIKDNITLFSAMKGVA